MIENKLQFYQTRAGYNVQKNAGNIPNDALVFVKDTHEIITHGEEGFGGNQSQIDARIANAINDLDSAKSQNAGADGLSLSITETDGKIVSISGSIAANTYDSYGSASAALLAAKTEIIDGATTNGNTLKKIENRVAPLETAVGTGGSVDERIATSKQQIIGDASSSGNTLGKLEDRFDDVEHSISLLDGHDVIVVDQLPSEKATPEDGNANVIYRKYTIDPNDNTKIGYEDYMYNSEALRNPIKIATYSFPGIDNEPVIGSENIVKSDGIAKEIHAIQSEIDGITKLNVEFSQSVTEYYVGIGDANYIEYSIKNINQADAYIGIRFVDDDDTVIASGGDQLIAQGSTYTNATQRAQIIGATKIKFTKIFRNNFEVEVTTDSSLIGKINKNTSDISRLNTSVTLFADLGQKILDTEIPTDKFGFINSNGGISSDTSGNNHRTDYIAVELGTKVYYKGSYLTSDFSAVYGYDIDKQPVALLLATGMNKELIIQINNSNIKYIVAWGDVSLGELKVSLKSIYDLNKLTTYEIVDANGNGDYMTLEDAIWGNISDRGDVSKHRTIIVMPGTYTMDTYYGNTARFWDVISNRNLSIIGVDRNACILKNTKGKYIAGSNRVDDACLKLSGNVLIKNLTLLASHENFDGAEGTSPDAYCIHLDSGGANCNLEIDNCIMVNKQQACIGIGTADNYTIQIRNCKLTTNVDTPSSFGSWSGTVICHNTDYSNPATLRLENNIMKSNTPNTLCVIKSGSYLSGIKLEAYRNIIGGNVNLDSEIVTLDELSYGNNKSLLNYQN